MIKVLESLIYINGRVRGEVREVRIVMLLFVVWERILLFIITGEGVGLLSYFTSLTQVTSSPGSVSSRESWERVQPAEFIFYRRRPR